MKLHRIALGPVRAASRTGRGVLADETERAIDAALGGPLPEMIGRALVERRVAERVVSEMLDAAAHEDGHPDGTGGVAERVLRSPALERWLAGEEAARLAEAVADRVVRSAAFRRAVAEMLASPEIHRALSQSATGFGAEAAEAARRKARAADDRAEARAHALLRRPQAARPGFAGVGTRGVALVVDAALAQAGFLLAAASVGLVLALVGDLRPGWLAGSLVGGGWLLVVTAYFVGFWSTTGQTPGLRVMRLRVVTRSAAPPSVARALARLVGLILAIVPLGAGFLPALVDRRRRALPDFLAGTAVVYEPGTRGP
jgi:uncharacterized RDD family membrane protein YckC